VTEVIEYPGSRIIYKAAPPFERSLADTDAERLLGLNAELIIDVWDPYAISFQNLPYLAWAMGALLWEKDWKEDTKREWTARQWEWKALRGTEAGIAMALDFMGRDFVGTGGYELVQALTPPAGFYASPNLTKEQHDAWIRMMPQIRIKFAVGRGYGSDEFFAAPAEGWENLLPDDEGFEPLPLFAAPEGEGAAGRDDGWELWGRKAVLRLANGQETPLKLSEWREATEARPGVIMGQAASAGRSEQGGFFAGVDFEGDDKFVCFEEEKPHIYNYRIDTTYEHSLSTLHLDYLFPDLEPIDIRYERNSDIGEGGPAFFAGVDFADDAYADPGLDAAEMLADRIYLHDPSVVAPMNEGSSFAGVDRVSVPAYHADLLVDLKTKEKPDSWIAGESFEGEGFAIPEDLKDFDRALRAVAASKALRDKVGVSFEVTLPIRFGDYLSEGTTFDAQVRNIL
jgi:phage tail P2-like protein